MASRAQEPTGKVILETQRFRLVADQERGGRIIEIRDIALGRNLLLDETPEGIFAFSDGTRYPVGGWDEAIPTIEPCEAAPALGYAWRKRAACRVAPNSLDAEWALPGLTLSRRISISGASLCAEYALQSDQDKVPALLWAAHALYPIEGLREVVLPTESPVLGPDCTEAGLAGLLETGSDALRITERRPLGRSWKFFVRTSRDILLHYEDATLRIGSDAPWFGVWVNTGLYSPPCVGIEPTNHPTDSLNEIDRLVAGLGGASVAWRLEIERP